MLETNQAIIKHKLGLLNLAEGGVEAFFDKIRRKPNRKNRVDEEIEHAVVAYAIEQPAHGQVRVSNELRKRGTFVSLSGVRSIWLKHDLHNFKLRLRALEAQVAETGVCSRKLRSWRLSVSLKTMLRAEKLRPHIYYPAGKRSAAERAGYLGSQNTCPIRSIAGS